MLFLGGASTRMVELMTERLFGRRLSAGEVSKADKKLLAFELAVYADRAEHYPSDLSIKFELGRRQLAAGRIDEAIGSLQQAQRDPKRRVLALALLGGAFARKDWHREAVETFQRALDHEPSEEQAKQLHYSLAEWETIRIN